VAAPLLCRECDGTGWIPYCSETLDGEFEVAYRLCPSCYAPRRCMGSKADQPCPHPGTVRHWLGYYCKEHSEDIHVTESIDQAQEAIYYLGRWLQVDRYRVDRPLAMELLEVLNKIEVQLKRAGRGLYRAYQDTGDSD
jgi:hypothetical protein